MDSIGAFSTVMVGATMGRPTLPDATARYLRLADFDPCIGLTGNGIDGPTPVRGLEAVATVGDVLVRGRGVPAAALVRAEQAGTYPSNDLLVVRPTNPLLDAAYLVAFLNLPQTQAALLSTTQGAATPRLSVQALATLPLVLPSLEEQRRIALIAQCANEERSTLNKLQELHWQLSQELLRLAVEKAHDEGSSPRRELHPANRSSDRAASPHVQARNT